MGRSSLSACLLFKRSLVCALLLVSLESENFSFRTFGKELKVFEDDVGLLVRRVQSACHPKEISLVAALDRLVSGATPKSPTFAHKVAARDSPKWEEVKGYDYFDATFKDLESKSIGISFELNKDYLTVVTLNPSGQAKKLGSVQVGDEVVAVNLRSLVAYGSLEKTVQTLVDAESPRTVRFRRKNKQVKKKVNAATPKKKAKPKVDVSQNDFTVTIAAAGPLGMHLLEDLSISQLSPRGILTKSGRVKIGDRLVAVNGISTVSPNSIGAAAAINRIVSATLPKTLTFRPDKSLHSANEYVNANHMETVEEDEEDEIEEAASANGEDGFLELVSPEILAGQKYKAVFAKFGISPNDLGCSTVRLELGQPKKGIPMGCTPLQDSKELHQAAVIIKRGVCSFVTKARNIERVDGVALIVVNEENKPLIAMPAAERELLVGPVSVPSAMISAEDGKGLSSILTATSVEAILRTPFLEEKCKDLKSTNIDGKNENENEKRYIENYQYEVYPSGKKVKREPIMNTIKLVIWSPSLKAFDDFTLEVDGLHAIFGSQNFADKASAATPSRVIFAPDPFTACDKLVSKDNTDFTGSIVVARRGGCKFTQKALNIQLAGGSAMVMINNQPSFSKLVPMSGDNSALTIKSIMVDSNAGKLLEALLIGEEKNDDNDPYANTNHNKDSTIAIGKIVLTTRYYCNRQKILCGSEGS